MACSPTVARIRDFSEARDALIPLEMALAASERPTFVLTYGASGPPSAHRYSDQGEE